MASRIFGHRGASGYAPENTLESFDMAAKMGAHGVELDVHICRSGELVVTHDETVERVSDGEGWVKDLSLKELKALRFNRTHPEFRDARIPTLQEVFQLRMPTIQFRQWFGLQQPERLLITLSTLLLRT